jgi:transposase
MAKARAPYPPTFRAAAVAPAKTSGKGILQFAPALGASAQALRGRIKCAEVDGGRGRPGEPTTGEREGLRRLRCGVKTIARGTVVVGRGIGSHCGRTG